MLRPSHHIHLFHNPFIFTDQDTNAYHSRPSQPNAKNCLPIICSGASPSKVPFSPRVGTLLLLTALPWFLGTGSVVRLLVGVWANKNVALRNSFQNCSDLCASYQTLRHTVPYYKHNMYIHIYKYIHYLYCKGSVFSTKQLHTIRNVWGLYSMALNHLDGNTDIECLWWFLTSLQHLSKIWCEMYVYMDNDISLPTHVQL